jgi:hypothetical protein
MNRGPASKVQTMPRSKREKKAFTQIQNPSLGPKPFLGHVEANQTKRERERERERGGILKERQA